MFRDGLVTNEPLSERLQLLRLLRVLLAEAINTREQVAFWTILWKISNFKEKWLVNNSHFIVAGTFGSYPRGYSCSCLFRWSRVCVQLVPIHQISLIRIRKLLRSLRDEHRKRTSYVLYLQQSRLTLLRILTHIGRLDQRVNKWGFLIIQLMIDDIFQKIYQYK